MYLNVGGYIYAVPGLEFKRDDLSEPKPTLTRLVLYFSPQAQLNDIMDQCSGFEL